MDLHQTWRSHNHEEYGGCFDDNYFARRQPGEDWADAKAYDWLPNKAMTEKEKLQSVLSNYDMLMCRLITDMLRSLDNADNVGIRAHIIAIVGTSDKELDMEKLNESISLNESIAKALIGYDCAEQRKRWFILTPVLYY